MKSILPVRGLAMAARRLATNLRLNPVAAVLAVCAVAPVTAPAHNLDTRATSISLAQDYLQTMTQRAGLNQPLMQVGDEFWVVIKTTPGPGTTTGVGGYQTFYVPNGAQVVNAAYVRPVATDPRGFVEIPMKGQSPIAIGAGSIGAKTAVGLTGYTYPSANILGVNEAPVTAGGLARGTIAGVYADTGIFYSTDTRTAFNSYGAAPSGGTAPMTNNSGDSVGEWDAAAIAGSDILGVMTLWDSYQLRAFGRKDVAPIIDPADGRGNAPWGMASAVAGPQSGYQWAFNYAAYLASGANPAAVPAAIEAGPWNRIKYPGSQISKDQAGLISTTLGYVGVDGSSIGYDFAASGALPTATSAIRFAIGQLELGRSEYSAVKVKMLTLPSVGSHPIYADAFGGDAGGSSNGKDHIWRYFDPTVVTLEPATLLQKVASDPHIAPGGTTSFAITFANLGSATLPNVVLTDVLPAGLSYVSAVPAPSTVSGSTLSWSLGSVAPSQMVNLTIYVKATATGTLLNTVTATSNGQVLENAYDTVDVGTISLLREEKTVTPSSVAAGQNVTYTITVSNDGSGPNGVPLAVTDFLPAGFTYASFVSATVNGASVTPTITSTNLNAPVFTLGQAIQAGSTAVIKFVATVGTGVTAGTYYNGVDLAFEGKKIGPHPEAPVTVGGGQIGDTLFRDWNGNGVQDTGDEGLPGVTVTLSGAASKSAVTDANGQYLFTGLAAGNYTVTVPAAGSLGVPSGYTITSMPPGVAGSTASTSIALTANQDVLTADWGYKPGGTGSIGDKVFEDLNNNGVWDTGEPGIPNTFVRLRNTSGVTILTTTTDASGNYLFSNLALGLPYAVACGLQGPATYFGADPYTITANNPIEISNLAGSVLTADFGFYRNVPAAIGDQVYYDANGSGTYNAGDTPLANVTVNLYASDGSTLLATTPSAVDGTYHFTGLVPGTYVVKVATADTDLPPNLSASTSQYTGVVVTAGQTDNTRDFPFVAGTAPLVKAVDKANAMAGDILTYTLTPTYTGSSLLTGVQVIDDVPSGTSYVNPSASPTPASQPANGGTGNVTWNLGSTAAAINGTKTFSNSTPATIAQRGSATQGTAARNATTLTINKPTSVVAGDVMIANIQLRKGTVTAYPSLSGWTSIASVNFENGGADHRCEVLYRVAGSSEGTSYTFNLAGGAQVDGAAGGIVAYSGVDTTSPLDAVGSYTTGSTKAISGVSAITVSANAAVLMCVGSFEGLTVGSFSTTSPGALTALYGSVADANGTVGAGWGIKTTAGSTGTGSATLSSAKVWGAILLALKPGSTTSYSYNTSTALSANRSMVKTGDTMAVTLTVTATGTGLPVTVTPGALGVTDTSGSVSVGSATPATQVLSSGVPATFTYNVTSITAGSSPGLLTFTATPSDPNGSWTQGTANTVIVTPPLTYQAKVNTSPAPSSVKNTAQITSTSGITSGFSNEVTTLIDASIGDFVWADSNGDGLQDSGEAGIPGVRVYVDSNGNGQYTAGEPNAITDSTGHYRIYGFTVGTYPVRYDFSSVPAGYVPTTAVQVSAVLGSGTTQFNDADFGLRPPAAYTGSIGDYVWLDANNDGVQDATESGIPTVTVKLYRDVNGNGSLDAADLLVDTTTTNASGSYGFSSLPIGSGSDSVVKYLVQVDTTTLAVGMAATTGTVNPKPVSLYTGAATVTTADFGYNHTGSIGDFVWWDNNHNGLQDESPATPIANAFVMLYADVNHNGILDSFNGDYQVAGTMTNASGLYLFSNLPAGNYLVDVYEDSIDVAGGAEPVPTTPNVQAKTLAGGEQYLAADFGYYQGARIEGNVFWDANRDTVFDSGENGLSPVTVTLTGSDLFNNPVSATVNTDAGGHFFFIVPEGNYTLTYSTPNVLAINPALTATTTPVSYTFHAYPGEDWHPVFNFGVDTNGSIGDTIFADVNSNDSQGAGEAGLANVTVELYVDANNNNLADTGETLLDSQLTDADGKYLFVGLANGNYVVKVLTATLPAGYQTTSTAVPPTESTLGTSQAGATVSGGGSTLDRDFGYPPVVLTYAVSGNVWDDNGAGGGTAGNGSKDGTEPGLGAVKVTLAVDADGAGANPAVTYTVHTDASGNYSLGGVPVAAAVIITVDKTTLPNTAYQQTGDPDATLDSATSFTMPNAAVSGKNFGYNQVLGSIAGTVVVGANGNGLADGGESGLAGATITLRYAGADAILNTADDVVSTPQVTTASGSYGFTGCLPGIYQVSEANPATYLSWADRDGGNPDNITVVLDFGPDGIGGNGDDRMVKTQQDFEDCLLATISGSVLADTDNNNSGDTAISGVTLALRDAATDALIATTTTNGTGAYTFSDVQPGSYKIVETQPAGYHSVSDKDGGNLDIIGDVTPVTVTYNATSSDNNFVEEQPGSLSGSVLADIDGNGTGDAPLAGVLIRLLDDAASPVLDGLGAPVTTLTLANGSYSFGDLPPGTYMVAEDQPANYQSVSDTDGANNNLIGDETPITVTAGLDSGNHNFIEIELGSIAGTVSKDTDNNGSGDAPLAGVILTLLDETGTPVDGDPDTAGVQAVTATTGPDGTYLFANVYPTVYQVAETQPAGYDSVSDADGGNPDLIGNVTPLTVAPGQNVTGRNFVDIERGSITGYVYVGAAPLAGVTLTLLDEYGNPVDGDPNTPDVQPVTTVTGADGSYTFSGVRPGIYQVAQTQPEGYISFGDSDGGNLDIIGDVTPIVVMPGQTNPDNNFIEALVTCPDTWAKWKATHPGQQAAGNPDGDAYDNLAEFAFVMPADSGAGNAWSVQPSLLYPDTLEGVYVRPKGALQNVTYTLQYASTPGNPTDWQSIVILPEMITVVNNGDCTETVTINDLEFLTDLYRGKGLVRIQVDLDEVPNTGTDHTSYTEAEGWKQTNLFADSQTYNIPYLRETTFTGTVSAVSGQNLVFATSAGQVDLATLLAPGIPYYLEVTAGDHEGQRFDVVSASGDTVTLATDTALHAATPPFNTHTGALPATLAGDRVVMRRHWKLNEVCPPSGFWATNSQSTADEVQVFAGGAWSIYWLYDENDQDPATAHWVDAADAGMADRGATVIPPGQGLFINIRSASSIITSVSDTDFIDASSYLAILAYGEVRANDFIRPLAVGYNLVGGGYPVDQSANGGDGRAMTLGAAGQGFFGSRSFKTADAFYTWIPDTSFETGYASYYLLNSPGFAPQWTQVGDVDLIPMDEELLFQSNRSVFLRSKNGLETYQIPRSWAP